MDWFGLKRNKRPVFLDQTGLYWTDLTLIQNKLILAHNELFSQTKTTCN